MVKFTGWSSIKKDMLEITADKKIKIGISSFCFLKRGMALIFLITGSVKMLLCNDEGMATTSNFLQCQK